MDPGNRVYKRNMKSAEEIRKLWGFAWAVAALPFAYAVLICLLIGVGYQPTKDWADEQGLWFP